MKASSLLVSVLICACANSGSGTTSTEPSEITTTIIPVTTTTTPSGPTLLLSHEDVDGANHLLVGAVAADDDVIHAYVVAFNDVSQWVVHVVWPVGTEDVIQERPNIEELGLDFDHPGPIPTSLVAANPGWHLYGQGLPLDDPTAAVFWAVSADEPGGPWERSPGIVMTNGEPGDWDEEWIDFPSVIGAPDGYVMAYQGATSGFTSDIGLAASPDGVEWIRPDEPLIPAEECDGARSLVMPRLVTADTGFTLAYLQIPEVGEDSSLALDTATTLEGLGCGEILLTRSDLPASGGIHSFGLFAVSDSLWLLVESLSQDAGYSDLWLVPVDSPH